MFSTSFAESLKSSTKANHISHPCAQFPTQQHTNDVIEFFFGDLKKFGAVPVAITMDIGFR